MADWYVSSATYASVPVWAATTGYTVGQFVKPVAPATGREYVFRCTVAGTSAASEPSWPTNNNATVASGGATFANVTGQSTYGWSAAAGKVYTISNAISTRAFVGDRVIVSSDSSENVGSTYAFGSAGFGAIQFISVNRAGSVPPVAADITPGATISNTAGTLTINNITDLYWEGITFSSAGNIIFANNDYKLHYLKNCAVVLANAGTTSRIAINTAAEITFDNTTVQFGHLAQGITSGAAASMSLNWLNTPSAVAGVPASLFISGSSTTTLHVTCRGVDLSGTTGNLFAPLASAGWCKGLLDSCKISSSATKLSTAGTNAGDMVELVNCHDGTNVLNERYTRAGAVTTDRSTTMSSGAADDIGAFSLKMVSNANVDRLAFPLDNFYFDVENTATGASKTATVEIISSGSLNNDDINLMLEYMGTSGNSQVSFVSSLPATILTAASALASSSATWNNPPGTPQKQYLQVTFTPQRAGRVRGLVRLGKVSTTVWVNPQITIS